MVFSGFRREAIEFLLSLQINNTMEQLPENKTGYKTLITEPLTLLFNDLVPVVLSVSPNIETKPSKCISSMYNDMRFAKGTPLKKYMYLRFREGCSEKDVIGLYFDMGCEFYSYGLRIYKQTSAGMTTIREDILKNEVQYIQALTTVTNSGATIMGDYFAKDHFPEIESKELKELLNRKGFYICYHKRITEAIFSSELEEELCEAFCNIKDFYMLLKKALYGEI
jgi:Uncharacterized conserved protein